MGRRDAEADAIGIERWRVAHPDEPVWRLGDLDGLLRRMPEESADDQRGDVLRTAGREFTLKRNGDLVGMEVAA